MSQQALEKYLWGAATALRNTIDKDYVHHLKVAWTASLDTKIKHNSSIK
jgi:hypothetical protein